MRKMREWIRIAAVVMLGVLLCGAVVFADEAEPTLLEAVIIETAVERPEESEASPMGEPDATEEPGQPEEPEQPKEPEQPEEPGQPEEPELPEADAAPEADEPDIVLTWVLTQGTTQLQLGDSITLQGKIDPDAADSLRFQWQVAEKPVADLVEGEAEWVDIPGAHGQEHVFVVADGMQGWRWRLRIDWAGSEPVYSDEMMLPEIADTVVEEVQQEAVLGAQDEALPVASITFTADVLDDEITYGAHITLTATIDHSQEDMQLQWQFAQSDGEWQDIADATGLTHAYTLSEENEGYLWRLLVTVPEAEKMEEAEAIDASTTEPEPASAELATPNDTQDVPEEKNATE